MHFRDGLKLELPAVPRIQISFLVLLVSLILPISSGAQGTGYNLGNLGVFNKWSKVEVAFTGPDMDGLNFDNHVGNGWVEVESSDSTTQVSGGKLVFDAADDSFRPLIYRSFALQDKGVMTWSFDLNFQRTGDESVYSFWMQLGQGSLMSDADPRQAGVAVNLKWGGPSTGLDTHEGLGYVLDGQVIQIAKVSGNKAVRVAVDLDHLTYSVIVGSQQVLEVPFDNIVAIDTVRFFAHQLHQANFGFREIDNLVLAAGESAPNNTLVADDFERANAETNPFKIDVDVSFSGPGGMIYVVPAFFEGDGNGGLQGDRWKVRFSPDRTGLWSFLSSSSNSQLDGYSGNFTVVSPPPEAESFVKWGRLKHVGEHYLKFDDGPYWLKGGADDPEDFLAPGVMGNWSQKKAAVDYLADKGINSMYIMLQTVDGDGDNVWPWVSRKGSEHFDVAKLAQWGDLFDHIQSKGIVLHLVFEDDSGWTGFNRYLYYREMIARFGHYNGLYWNISEEYGENYSADEVKSFAQMVRDIDPYDHPISVHNLRPLSQWADFLGDSRFDITSFQAGETPQNAAAIEWREASSAAGYPIAISFDETGETSPADRKLAREIVWSVYMGGGNYELHTYPLETFQQLEGHWNDLGHARLFVESLPFWEMGPWNDLLVGGTGNRYCFAKDGEIYAVYLAKGGTVSLDLTGVANSYQVTWFNPVTGIFTDGAVITGGGVRSLGSPPFSGDAAAMVKRTGQNQNQSPLAYDFTISTGMGNSVGISLTPYILDGDGPGPYQFTILEQPSHGTLIGSGSEGTYTPEPGFTGQDTFTWRCNDGLDDSNVATATIVVNSGPATNSLLTEDFEKSDSATVGNGWVEVESGVSKTRVAGGKLVFDAADDAFRPLIYHGVPIQQAGVMTWSFDLNFQRTGDESVYSFWMQLGQRSLMSDADPREAGVAVNLKWGGPAAGMNTHEGLAYVLNGQVHQFAIVEGIETVTVVVDLDQQLYSVAVGQQQALEIPFDNSVSIDTVRFFAHELNRANFAFRELDNVVLALEQSEPVNTSPTALNQNVSSFATLPVSIKLSYSDPDGPGPYSYSIISEPAHGSLSGIAPDLVYTADRGFSGIDSFTWNITDGLDESNVATVSITVEPNMPPVVNDFTASTLVGIPVNVSLSDYALDTDGPDPVQCYVLAGPDNGELVGIAGSVGTYTPEPGFTGQDAFTWRCNDGLDDSNVATATIVVNSGPGTYNSLLIEDFETSDSATVGNGWVEVESGVSKTRVAGGKLVFDPADDAFRPLIYHGVPTQQAGVMTWSFDLNFQRTGSESVYSFWMQLGQRSLMSNADPREAGVAVNLKWGGPAAGMNTHEGLAYVLNGQVHQFATVKGIDTVTVVVDLDQQFYSVAVGQQQALEVPFDNSVSIDTVRFFAHELHGSHFAFRELDNVVLALDSLMTEDFERTNSATVGNGWIEVESSVSKTRVAGGKLVFDAADDAFRPLIYHGVPTQQAGVMTWSFDLNFQRTSDESVYSFWMQLGQRSLMSDADPRDGGVAVNLKWGGPAAGMNTHEGLAYVLNGQVHQFATVKGINTVTVVVDLDQQFYSVAVGQQQVLEVPFDNSVSIDTIRFFAHELNRANFAFRELDNVTLQ